MEIKKFGGMKYDRKELRKSSTKNRGCCREKVVCNNISIFVDSQAALLFL